MDRLEAMATLLAAVDAGSFSAASRQLHVPLATVSRRVSALEEHLGIRLLLRGTRKLVLTDAGRDYVTACRRLLEGITEAERVASGEYHAPQGELVISAPQVIAASHLVPVVVEFLRTYPSINAHVLLNERNVNLVEEQVDVAMRVGELPDSSLTATRIGLIRVVLCASPEYLDTHGVPEGPTDLTSHDCVTYQGNFPQSGNKWDFRQEGASQLVEVRSRLMVNSGEAAIIAATAGGGIARLSSSRSDPLVESGLLVRVLEAYEPTPVPISLIYPSQRQVPSKLRAFLDFSVPRLRDRLGYERR